MKKETMKKQETMQFNSTFQFPLTRVKSYYYSTINSTLVQLSEDLEFLYRNLRITHKYNMSQDELSILQQMLLSGFYTISPLRLKRIRRDDLEDFLFATLPSFPDLTFYPSKDSSFYIAVYPSKKEDVLVFMALSIHFYRYTFGSVPEVNYRLLDRVDQFYSGIKKMGKVTRLYRINMDVSLQVIDDSQVLNVVKSFVGADSVCYKLVSSFLNLDTLDEDGKKVHFNSMPVVGEITRILFNLAFLEFDQQLCRMYPGIVFERFMGLVFIASTDDIIIDEYQLYDMILDLGLTCELDFIGPGDEPLECRHRMVALDNNGKVVVNTPTDYG